MELRQAHQSVQPFRTQDEYLYAMKEDLAEWFNGLYDIDIGVNDFFQQLEDGVVICRHANNVQYHILQANDAPPSGNDGRSLAPSSGKRRTSLPGLRGEKDVGVYYRTNVHPGTFQSRDNISNFITWCRHTLRIPDTLLFETDDLVLRKNERSVVLCLLEVARQGSKFGLPVPVLVQLEQEIDAEIAAEKGEAAPHQYYPVIRKRYAIKVDMKSLDELVRDVLSRCTCPDQFPMVRVSDGKYKIGDSQTMIFLRILRSHVMVRIGGGWDTLENYLNRHDPCRCQAKSGHGSFYAWSGSSIKDDAATVAKQPEDGARFTPERSNQKHSSSETNHVTITPGKPKPQSTSPGKPKPQSTSFIRRLSISDSTDSTLRDTNGTGVEISGPKKQSHLKSNGDKRLLSPSEPGKRPRSATTDKATISDSRRPKTGSKGHSAGEIHPGDAALIKSGRKSLLDSFRLDGRTQSSERPPKTSHQGCHQSSTTTTSRARSLDPEHRVATSTDRSYHLPRTPSKVTSSEESNSRNFLIVTRDQRGRHQVQNSPGRQEEKTSGAKEPKTDASSTDGIVAKDQEQQQQQQQPNKVKATKMQISASRLLPSMPRILARSNSLSPESKVQEGSGEFRRSASLSRSSMFDGDDATANQVVVSPHTPEPRTPLSPQKSELLIEEYRKFGLCLQDLIKNADELDMLGNDAKENIDGRLVVDKVDLQETMNCRSSKQISQQNETFFNVTSKTNNSPTLNPASNLSPQKEQRISTGDQTNELSLCNPALIKSQCMLESLSGVYGSNGNQQGIESHLNVENRPFTQVGLSEIQNRTTFRKNLAPNWRKRSEPDKSFTSVRSSSANRYQPSSECANRSRSSTREEDYKSLETMRSTAAGKREILRQMGHDLDKSSGHCSRTTSTRNRDRGFSRDRDKILSKGRSSAHQIAFDDGTAKDVTDHRTSVASLAEAGENRRVDVDALQDFSLQNLDEYCRRALIRKDVALGPRPSTRIPMPMEAKWTADHNDYRKIHAQLKRVDSGVDINLTS